MQRKEARVGDEREETALREVQKIMSLNAFDIEAPAKGTVPCSRQPLFQRQTCHSPCPESKQLPATQ